MDVDGKAFEENAGRISELHRWLLSRSEPYRRLPVQERNEILFWGIHRPNHRVKARIDDREARRRAKDLREHREEDQADREYVAANLYKVAPEDAGPQRCAPLYVPCDIYCPSCDRITHEMGCSRCGWSIEATFDPFIQPTVERELDADCY